MTGMSAMEFTETTSSSTTESRTIFGEHGLGTTGLLIAILIMLAFILLARPWLLLLQRISDTDWKNEKQK
jgi:hypothetical protein